MQLDIATTHILENQNRHGQQAQNTVMQGSYSHSEVPNSVGISRLKPQQKSGNHLPTEKPKPSIISSPNM